MLADLSLLSKCFKRLKESCLDDFVDRCNHHYSVLLLLFFALLVGSKQHFGEPIRCLIDQQYPESWVAYVHDYCFISQRYSFVPSNYEEDDELASFDPTVARKYENYYQWVPFILAAQAVLFLLPRVFFTALQSFGGLDFESIVEEAARVRATFGEDRRKAVANLVKYIEQCMGCSFTASRLEVSYRGQFGTFSSAIYVLSKLFNVGITVLQLAITSFFVGDGNWLFGIQLAEHLLADRDWTLTGQFPRVVFCDYERMELANLQHKSVQCALAINVLNEKLYILLAFWLMALFVITVANTVYTAAVLFIPGLRKREASFYLTPVLGAMEKKMPLFLNGNAVNGKGPDDEGLAEGLAFGGNTVQRIYDIQTKNGIQYSGKQGADERQSVMDAVVTRRYDAFTQCEEKILVDAFVSRYLHVDGVQLLRFVSERAGSLLASEIACALFIDFRSSDAVLRSLHKQQYLYDAPLRHCPKPVCNPGTDGNANFAISNANFHIDDTASIFHRNLSDIPEEDEVMHSRFMSCSCPAVGTPYRSGVTQIASCATLSRQAIPSGALRDRYGYAVNRAHRSVSLP